MLALRQTCFCGGGFLLERVPESDHPGRLAALRKVVSAEAVLQPEVARLSLQVAQRYAGTRSDVLRLAVPPRHARVEKEPRRPVPDPVAAQDASPLWAHYPTRLVEDLRSGGSPRAVWTVLPGDDPMRGLADTVAATLEHAEPEAAGENDFWHETYLYSRAASVYGGTRQIQRDIIADRVLALPKE